MSYYYNEIDPNDVIGTNVPGPWNPKDPLGPTDDSSGSYQVGYAWNEYIDDDNFDGFEYFNNGSTQPAVSSNFGQTIKFVFSIKADKLTGTIPKPGNDAKIGIYKFTPTTDKPNPNYLDISDSNYVAFAHVPKFVDHDGSPPGTEGYGVFPCYIDAVYIKIGLNKDKETITWLNGHKLEANTTYLIRAETWQHYTASLGWLQTYGIYTNTQVGSQKVPDPKYNIYENGLYQENTYDKVYNGFALFKTLKEGDPIPPEQHPIVDNGILIPGLQTNYNIETTVISAKLTCNFYYSNTPVTDNIPTSVGFKWRKKSTTSTPNPWSYTYLTWNPNWTSYVGINNVVNADYDLAGLEAGTDYEYISYVVETGGKIFTSAKFNRFRTKVVIINEWQKPPNGITWYQIYNDWELKTNPSYFQVRKLADIVATSTGPLDVTQLDNIPPLQHKNASTSYSLYYYLNKVFLKEKNYQFRTIIGGFYKFRGSTTTSSTKSNFSIKTPWGEKLNFSDSTPYLPLYSTESIDAGKLMNLLLYTNINSFDSNPAISKIPNIKPIERIVSKNNPQNPISFSANPYFCKDTLFDPNTGSKLYDVNVSDLDWTLQGFGFFNFINYTGPITPTINQLNETIPLFVGNDPIGGKGWHFIEKKGSFIWFDKYNQVDLFENDYNLPIGGDINNYYYTKSSSEKYLVNNFVTKYITYQTFNISFNYINNSEFKLTMYTGGVLPSFVNDVYNLDNLISSGYVKSLATLTKSNNGSTQSCEFIGVEGNQFLFFVADPIYKHLDDDNKILTNSGTTKRSTINDSLLTTTTYSVITITDFKIGGSYNEYNNQNFDINTLDYSTTNTIENATYSIKLGVGNNVIDGSINNISTVYSLAGNGRFNSGIWENGVWNNGWREDLTRRDFFKIDQFYSYEKDKKWRVKISGSTTQSFKIGDKVSISNIVAIDINEERKLLKKYYNIIDIGSNYVEVEFENDFPLRRIEMDSIEHRIHISKNVWLSGVFLNGYFKGIWNSGLFSGYPLITKMDDSHWIDGIFNGGHFTAKKYGASFSSIFPYDLNGVTRLGLSFSKPHNLTVDDIISVNPSTYTLNGISVNTSLGTTVVSEVIDRFRLSTGISWKTENMFVKNGGYIYTIISTGLIQNFDFYSNNVSKVTSLQSQKSERVFSYNSWIDVNYSNQSAVNIGKPQSILEGDTKRSYSENNLYGYPTNDVLSSNSVFRDSFSTSMRKYKLGKKWKIFNDYVGDSSSFEEYFDSSDTIDGINAFNTQGWDISLNSDTNVELIASSIDYTESNVQGDTSPLTLNSMTMSFYNDITYILPEVVMIEGTFNNKSYTDFPNASTIYYPSTETKYISSATISHVNYDPTTNKTDISVETEIPVFEKIDPNVFHGYHERNYLDKLKTTYLRFERENGLTFSRTPEPLNSNSPTIGKELKVKAINKGGYLNLIPAYDVLNRVNGTDTQTLEKSRYTMIEFDIVDYISLTSSYIDPNNGYKLPSIHFNNLNYITRNINYNSATFSLTLPARYLPINKNINHLLTRNKKKQEFFFNKRNLLMNFKGTGVEGSEDTEYYLDNLKLYEVNMIPFFQYFISPINVQGNINKSVQIPNSGVSPLIDFSDDSIIDASDSNDILTFFSNSLIASNIEIPAGINWERDYSIYRTQIAGDDIFGNNDLYNEN